MENNIKTPETRFELLGDRLKTRFFDFMLVSLLMGLFLIPYIVWIIVINNSSFFVPTQENYLLVSLITFAPYIPLTMIFGLGVVGALYYSKRLAFGEGANASKDFFYGISKNIKPALLGFFIIGLMYFALSYGKIIIMASELNPILKGVLIGLIYVGFIIITMIVAFYLSQSVLYTGTTGQLMMNAVKFTFGMFGWNLLIFLIVLLPFIVVEVVSYLPSAFFLIEYIFLAICILFYFEFEVFVFSIYSHAIFDLTINDDYPEIYRKGLTPKEPIE
ncbi:MAG: hypothetical protein J5511_02760 [Bacilli bacterium]|nr:hypothetical protein [Bacilli bacterium]